MDSHVSERELLVNWAPPICTLLQRTLGNMRVARGEAQRQAHFVLHNLAFTTAEVVDMLRDPKAEQVLRTKSQLIRALENGDDFDVDVQKEFEDQRLGAILEVSL